MKLECPDFVGSVLAQRDPGRGTAYTEFLKPKIWPFKVTSIFIIPHSLTSLINGTDMTVH